VHLLAVLDHAGGVVDAFSTRGALEVASLLVAEQNGLIVKLALAVVAKGLVLDGLPLFPAHSPRASSR
jgi:hypothetical protein